MDYYLNKDWTKDIRQQTPFPGMPTEWKIFLTLISAILIMCTLLSIIKLGYSLTMAFIKFSFLCLVFLLEVILISSLLYPIKGVHWILIKVIEFFGTKIIRFLESRLDRSVINRFFTGDIIEKSFRMPASENHQMASISDSNRECHEIKQI